MQFLATLALFAAAAVAAPADLQARADLCNGDLYSQAQCCSTDVLGVADLDCAVRTYLTQMAFLPLSYNILYIII